MTEKSSIEISETTEELAVWLGGIMMMWPYLELHLFALFQALSRSPKDRAEVIWFSLTSIEMRLRIMTELTKLTAPGTKRNEVMALIASVRDLNIKRNRLTHWMWMPEDGGNGWAIGRHAEFRQGKPMMPISVEEVKELSIAMDKAGEKCGELSKWVHWLDVHSDESRAAAKRKK